MQKYANLVELEKCCQTHIFFAKFRFDTAENQPAKNLQKIANPDPPSPSTAMSTLGFLSTGESERMTAAKEERRRPGSGRAANAMGLACL